MKKVIKTAQDALKVSRSESGFQQKIERYQIANNKQDYSKDERVKRASKVLQGIKDREAQISQLKGNDGKPVRVLSNYSFLAELFMKTLASIDEKAFLNEAEKGITRDLNNAQSKVTKEQEAVLVEFHTNKAHANWDKVQEIRILLTEKKLLKGKDAANTKELERVLSAEEAKNAKAAQMPTELEIQELEKVG